MAISQVQVCHLAPPLSSVFTLTISGLFHLFVQFWPSSGPSGAGGALLPLTARPPGEAKSFRCSDFSLVPSDQCYRCPVAGFLPLGRAISLLLAHRAGQSCQSKPTLGCPKLNLLFCGVRSSALLFGSQTMNGHPNQRFWGVLSWVGGDIQKAPPPQPMISIIASYISESRICFFQNSVLIFSRPPEFQLSGGHAECSAIVWVVGPLLALGFSSHLLVFYWGEKPCEAPRRPSSLGTSRLREVVKSTQPRLIESLYLHRRSGRNML